MNAFVAVDDSGRRHSFAFAGRREPHTKARSAFGVLCNVLSAMPLVAIATVICVASLRLVILLFETFEIVRAERSSDADFILLCADGAASSSPRMRSACMEANAAHASPMVVSVLMRSGAAFVNELWSFVSKPVQSLSIAGVLGTVGALPWLGQVKSFLWPNGWRSGGEGGARTGPDFRDDHVVVVGADHAHSGGMYLRHRPPTRVLEPPAFMEEASNYSDTYGPLSGGGGGSGGGYSGFVNVPLDAMGNIRQSSRLKED